MKFWVITLSLAGAISTAAAGDRVYTAGPLYRGELLVHGLGFSPDHRTLDVVSIGSNSVTLIDTETNTVSVIDPATNKLRL